MATIAIDFDGTFTADRDLWAEFINTAQNAGHTMICVTARSHESKESDYVRRTFAAWGCDVPIVFTDSQSKIDAMQSEGIAVDIWIDNDPVAVVSGTLSK